METKVELESTIEERGDLRLEGQVVDHVVHFYLRVPAEEEGEVRKIELPDVRFVLTEDDSDPRPHGPDRARAWKKASEWLVELVISRHPELRERRYRNRVKAEKWYLHREEEPEYYRWQDDEEILQELRPSYEAVARELTDTIGRPRRSDFSELFPHKYDDPGLSERARRAVRDLKDVFGEEVLVVERAAGKA